MLDIKLLRNEPETVRQTLADRGVEVFSDVAVGSENWAERSVERLADIDKQYRDALQAEEDLRSRQNANTKAMKDVGKLPKSEQGAARTPLIEEGKRLREQEKEFKAATAAALAERDEAWGKLPNLTHPESPRGMTDDDHNELRKVGTPRDFAAEGFEPRDHLAICEALQLADFAAGAKVSGQKFYYLKNQAVILDLALQRYALDIAVKARVHAARDAGPGAGGDPAGAGVQSAGGRRRRSTPWRTRIFVWWGRPRSRWAGCWRTRSWRRRTCRSFYVV